MRRRLISSLLAAMMAVGGMVVAAPASQAAQPCGMSQVKHTSWTYVASNRIYRQTPYTTYFRNCSSVTVKKRLDIALGFDLACQTVTPYATVSWYWVKNSANPSYIRGVTSC
ncbi:hypothetical protein [Cellulosimicrobium marinum]|uniref:hypothetical protein n=1 Tax=Cellulosimicrobium marinum TaxID=1638992 RepID=UPI001E39DEAD|nr:hypothetical protein [Cellulosimicrobium marinum]MCB7135233.1 hypothetical protein [Cellulosimicrobium marinum]